MKGLDLGSNELLEITRETFQSLTSLEMLFLNKNKIEEIEPEAIRAQSSSLTHLDLRENKIYRIHVN